MIVMGFSAYREGADGVDGQLVVLGIAHDGGLKARFTVSMGRALGPFENEKKR